MKKRVLKFGGTSMGSAQAMIQSAFVSASRKADVVVVSATSGTTNLLIELGSVAEKQNEPEREKIVQTISQKHLNLSEELKLSVSAKTRVKTLVDELEALSKGILLVRDCSLKAMDSLMSLGERLSSAIFEEVLQKAFGPSRKVQWLDARSVIRTDSSFSKARPLMTESQSSSDQILHFDQDQVYVTQGFIGSTLQNETTTLGRGGSDYSAALFAELVKAEVCEIWTDVPGIATTDPRICKEARAIPEITFQEASELATFGAKVLHPATLLPAIRHNIPVYVANTFAPEVGGTWVQKDSKDLPLVRAVAIRKKQSLVTLTTPEMLQAHGFLFQIFKIFNDFKTSIDAITTSEISVSMTVEDSILQQKSLIEELSKIADVSIESNLSLVSLIGNKINHTPGLAKQIFEVIPDINVRMICLGASKHNFCFLVKDESGEDCVRRLHQKFVEGKSI